MKINEAYNSWSATYDTVANKTRDLEKIAAQQTLQKYTFDTVVELGCGTGKNTEWLAEKAVHILALDFSSEMLEKAKAKIQSPKVEFRQTDINQKWQIESDFAGQITCSLILEHIQILDFIFSEAHRILKPAGKFYICELHPFKQYSGSKARFESESGLVEIEVYVHHVSEYVHAALQNGFKLLELREWFDEGNTTEIPRLISFVFEKQ